MSRSTNGEVRAWWALALALALGGCMADVGDVPLECEGDACEEVEPGAAAAAEEELRFTIESPSRLTLYSEAGFWGTRLTRTLDPTTALEHRSLVRTSDIDAASLRNRISSVRLECGSRSSMAILYLSINEGATIGSWSEYGVGYPIHCEPGETASVELHTDDARAYADRVLSVYFIAHAREISTLPLSFLVGNAWSNQLDDLPSGAEADGGPRMRLASDTAFRIRQNLRLDHWACTERGAHFELTAYMRQDRTFLVSVRSTYVDYGFGDAWGCRDDMLSALRTAASRAAVELEDGLEEMMGLMPEEPRYYFVPTFATWGPRDFELVAGGEPALGGIVLDPIDEVYDRRGI